MKKLLTLTLILCLLFAIGGCKDNNQNTNDESQGETLQELYIVPETGTFSYAEVLADWEGFNDGVMVRRDGFKNTEKIEITSREQIIELAKKEYSASQYDTIEVAYDKEAKVYSVWFHIRPNEEEDIVYLGGGQTVYISDEGVTLLAILGE